ncbi:hypothetical protein A2U01_0070571, partial [Trifolium medium]|nr:hypothetical protein [Trifolium medium]
MKGQQESTEEQALKFQILEEGLGEVEEDLHQEVVVEEDKANNLLNVSNVTNYVIIKVNALIGK